MSDKLKLIYKKFVNGENIENLISNDEIEDLIEEIEELDINQLLTKLFYLEASVDLSAKNGSNP